jgi:hypothetical protein
VRVVERACKAHPRGAAHRPVQVRSTSRNLVGVMPT